MPTYNRRRFVPQAIEYFLRQDYSDKELLIVDDGEESVEDLALAHRHIRYMRQARRQSVGAKRNVACEAANGEIIVHWDDDDWSAPWRLSYQVRELLGSGADVCGLDRVLFADAGTSQAWEYVYPKDGRPWVYGATLCYWKRYWRQNPFPNISVGEDSRFVWNARGVRILALPKNTFFVGVVHSKNTSPKQIRGLRWQPRPTQMIQSLMSSTEWAFVSEKAVDAGTGSRRVHRPPVLVSAAYGIGDILRVTPLIRVLHRMGYDVDVLLAPDYPETIELLRGAPEIRRILHYPQIRRNRGAQRLPELDGESYELATFTTWSAPLSRWVTCKVRHVFPQREWLSTGDLACVEKIARALGWQQPLPEPFAMTSSRKFDVAPGTVALHPGCKPDWPWKKWHGFAELAERLNHVVLIGTVEDLDVAGTYFGRPFQWPPHARNYMGQLSLPETAAMIKQCAALVCNDSGLQHIAAAVGTPAYPIFGITSPAREIIPVAHVHPVTKGLACESACHSQQWGRRDCHRHLECLKTLGGNDVLERLQRDGIVPLVCDTQSHGPQYASVDVPSETIRVAVRVDGGIGDVLLASPLLEALFDELRRCEIDVFYHQPETAQFIFFGARFVRAVHATSQLRHNERHYDVSIRTLQFIRYEVRDGTKLARVCPEFAERLRDVTRRFERVQGLANRQPSLDGLWGRISVLAGRSVLDSIGFLGGVPVTRDSELFLAPDPAAYRAVSAHIGGHGQRYITLHDGFDNNVRIAPGAATKCWPLDHWQGLTAKLKAWCPDVRLVQVGARKSRRIPGVDLDLVDRTSLHEAAWIMKHAQLHVDTDSGLVHIARALHTPAVVLFGPTDAGYYGHASNTNLAATGCANCWWSTPDWLARCPRGLASPECMESIRPDAVFDHVVQRLAVAQPVTADAGPVTCYDSAMCRTEHATLVTMCEALDLPVLPISQHIKNNRNGVYIHASKQWEYLYALKALAKGFGPEKTGLRIADLGGGRGALAPYLAHEGHSVEVFDMDYQWDHGGDSAVELRYRQWARRVGYQARYGSLYNIPAPSNSFDALTSISVVEHVPYKEYVLKEALRVVRPGGLLILTFDFANNPERFEDGMRREIFSPERLQRTLGQLGISCTAPDVEAVKRSAQHIHADGVCGIPQGMTVAAMVIRKADASTS